MNINTLVNRPVLVENQETKRYLFSDGEPIKGNRGDEGGCIRSEESSGVGYHSRRHLIASLTSMSKVQARNSYSK